MAFRFSIVIPTLNSAALLDRTLQSIREQSFHDCQVIVVDGASNDDTAGVVKRHLLESDCFISEPDTGMYDALQKGFRRATGEIQCWLNAGDVYFPYTLEAVDRVFRTNPSIQWLTGVGAKIDPDGVLYQIKHPTAFFQSLIRKGYYRDDYIGCISQEATFWRSEIFSPEMIRNDLRLAGDYDLWIKLSRVAKLYTVKTVLAGFLVHEGQLSSNGEAYLAECNLVSSRLRSRLFARIAKLIGILNNSRLISASR
ncbi:MAG: glycosyltransferase [Spirochaetaceae bacterium]